MGLFKRISDIVSANLGELAEEYENPELMLKQAIREMEESIREATQETAKALAGEKKVARELAHNQTESGRWGARAEQAVDSGDDELARKALARKQEHDRLAAALHDQQKSAAEAGQTLRRQLDGMKAKLDEAKRNLATLSARQRAADVRKKVYSGTAETPDVSLDDSAFNKFERMREKVEQAEAEADALAELRGAGPYASAPDVDGAASGDDEIEAELQALKEKRAGG